MFTQRHHSQPPRRRDDLRRPALGEAQPRRPLRRHPQAGVAAVERLQHAPLASATWIQYTGAALPQVCAGAALPHQYTGAALPQVCARWDPMQAAQVFLLTLRPSLLGFARTCLAGFSFFGSAFFGACARRPHPEPGSGGSLIGISHSQAI